MKELELKSISKSYGKKQVLNNLSCKFGKGIYGLLGPNGAGKTTLISIIVNILKANSGEVLFSGEKIEKMGKEYFRNIGYLPQYPRFYSNYTAQEFLEYIAVIKGLKRDVAKKRIDELFEFVNLQNDRKKKVGAYSGGMRQRLGVAQAIINNPQILILDEPTAGLDPKERIRFRNLISSISQDKTVILATHIVSDVEYMAKEVVMLDKGRFVCNDTPANLINSIGDKVWNINVPENTIDECMEKYVVSNVQHTDNGFLIKTVGDKPSADATQASATLEEVYLYYISEGDAK